MTLYELLVGVPAFPETDRTRLLQLIAETNPIPPRHHDPTIPRDLETIVLKASARDPADRYEAPTELAADLRRFLAGQAICAHRTGLGVRLVRWVRHNPVFAFAVATTILLTLLLISFVGNALLTPSRTARSLESPAQSPPASVGPGRTEATRPTPSGRPDGPPWGFGRRHMPAGAGAGTGFDPRGPRHGMSPQ